MKFILVCCVAAFVAGTSASPFLDSLPSLPSVPLPTLPSLLTEGPSYYQMFKAVSSIHSALSNTPLKAFLPSVTDMVVGALKVASAAKDTYDAVNKVTAFINNTVKQAADKAKVPLDAISQITSQLQSSVGQALGAVQSTGSVLSENIASAVPANVGQSSNPSG